jgi:excisionase family DNA binding protein
MNNETDNGEVNSLDLSTVERVRPRQRKNVIPPGTIRMLSIREIARRYKLHENTVRRWVTEDKLKHIRYGPGGKIYIAEKDAEKFYRKYYF